MNADQSLTFASFCDICGLHWIKDFDAGCDHSGGLSSEARCILIDATRWPVSVLSVFSVVKTPFNSSWA